MLKYRLDLKIYDEVVEINDEVKSLDKKLKNNFILKLLRINIKLLSDKKN